MSIHVSAATVIDLMTQKFKTTKGKREIKKK